MKYLKENLTRAALFSCYLDFKTCSNHQNIKKTPFLLTIFFDKIIDIMVISNLKLFFILFGYFQINPKVKTLY